MTYAIICDKVRELQRKYDEHDPFRLCRAMGIHLVFRSLGTHEDCIKGFFIERNRIWVITVNSDLPLVIQKIIAAHELGHAVLRRKEAHAFHDVAMFDSISVCEKEANLFAAEYLMDDDEVLEALNRDGTFFNAASQLMVPAELLDFKFRMLKWKGYQMMESPIAARSNFLRDLSIPVNTDYESC